MITKTEKLTIIFSFVALIVSFLSLGINYWSYSESFSSKLDYSFSLEDSKTNIEDRKIRFEKTNNESYPVHFKIKYIISLRNMGIQPLTIDNILSKLLFEKKSSVHPIFITDKDSKLIEFPFIIEKKRVKKFRFELSIRIPDHAWEKVKDQFKINEEINLTTAKNIFESKKISLFGRFSSRRLMSVWKDASPYSFVLIPYKDVRYIEGIGFWEPDGWQNRQSLY